ncbi:MAG: endonuclease/exonuclease/phosphatase family protein [Kiritimatiellae bacterium]|nr:endonuclease/exonuclease/phosphatase family protein [Kiritimatiellia bacterium]
MQNRPARIIRRLLQFGIAGLAVVTVLGFTARAFWLLELFCHFRVQYGLAFLVCGALAIALRRPRLCAIAVVGAALNLSCVVPLFLGGGQGGDVTSVPSVRVMLLNVNTTMGDPAAVRRLVVAEDPDVLLLQEVSASWLQQLHAVLVAYPYTVREPREDNFGIALYSKYPLSNTRVVLSPDVAVPSIRAELAIAGQRVCLIAVHTVPPKSGYMARARNLHLKQVADWVDSELPTVLFGDLNVSSYSPYFGDLLRSSGLRDSMRGYGVQASWPTMWPWLHIPLDHVLISEQLMVQERRVGPNAGSDHFPVLFSFAWRPGGSAQ